ncbi:MAG: CrcB family protein [Balneolaceae bacterium]|nr:MAG: CrcB family protein [Balneolaceae bacterium]
MPVPGLATAQVDIPMLLLWLAGAGAAGACLRYGVDRLVHRLFPTSLPVGILAVNLSGSLFIGLLFGALAAGTGMDGMQGAGGIHPEYHSLWLTLSVGFAGSYTTFSGWMVQTVELLEAGDLKDAFWNLFLSILPGLLLTLAGIQIGLRL